MISPETIQTARSAFLKETSGSRHAREIATAIDHILAWSVEQAPALAVLPAGEQTTVGIGLRGASDVLWRAYPRERDGAKIVVLPGVLDALSGDAQAALRAAFDAAVPGGEFASAGYLQCSLVLLADEVNQRQFRVALSAALAALRAHRDAVAG